MRQKYSAKNKRPERHTCLSGRLPCRHILRQPQQKKAPYKGTFFVDLEDRIQFLTDVFQLVFNFHKYNNCNPKLRRTV